MALNTLDERVRRELARFRQSLERALRAEADSVRITAKDDFVGGTA